MSAARCSSKRSASFRVSLCGGTKQGLVWTRLKLQPMSVAGEFALPRDGICTSRGYTLVGARGPCRALDPAVGSMTQIGFGRGEDLHQLRPHKSLS